MRVVATAGHVDHGKSSLVLALTGTDPDRFAEEKRRGLTIDLGFAHTDLPSGAEIAFVDVPGHVRFVKNMLAGVGAVDACLFVVAATEGWKPQSEEHLRILELVGVRHGVVALTKIDLVDDEVADLAELEIAERTAGTFLATAPVIRTAVPEGRGLDALRVALDEMVQHTPAAGDRGRARLWVDRSFAAAGAGTIVTGTLTGGSVAMGDTVEVGPVPRTARVRGVQVHNRTVDRVGPGHRVALNLVGIERGDVLRGDAVVHPDRWHRTTTFDAALEVLATLDHDVTRRGAFTVHVGSGEHPARVRVVGAEAVAPGATGVIRVRVTVPLPLVPGDRYVLRESGRDETAGGGEILDVAPVLPLRRARPDRSWERVVAERGWVLATELERLTGSRVAPTHGPWVVAPAAAEATRQRIEELVANAGTMGLDIAGLTEQERIVLPTVEGVTVTGGRARAAGATDPLNGHPVLAQLERGGTSPPEPVGVSPAELRELVRRGLVIERDGVYFSPAAVELAAAAARALLAGQPQGFTASELREALGTSRKYALPLANELDARGITRRRGDVRIAGPRLPT